MSKSTLTVKQQKFADLYLQSGNGTQSYLEAGYKAKNIRTAESSSSQLLRKPKVEAYLNQQRATISEKSTLDTAEIVSNLSDIATCDIEDLFNIDDSGNITLVPKSDRSKKVRKSIKKIKIKHDKDGNQDIEVELYDKLKATEMLGKHFGMFNQKLDVALVDGTKQAEIKAMFDSMSTQEKLAWLKQKESER